MDPLQLFGETGNGNDGTVTIFIGSSIVDGTIQFMSDMTSAHRCVDSRKQAVPLVYSAERWGAKW
jgi:hypothetical protein